MKKILVMALLGVLATPASSRAADDPWIGVGAGFEVAMVGEHIVTSTVGLNTVATGVLSAQVVFDCRGIATPDAASTGIDQCYFQTQSRVCNPSCGAWAAQNTVNALNTPNNFSGPLAQSVGTTTGLAKTTNTLRHVACHQASAAFMESALGPHNLQTTLSCQEYVVSV